MARPPMGRLRRRNRLYKYCTLFVPRSQYVLLLLFKEVLARRDFEAAPLAGLFVFAVCRVDGGPHNPAMLATLIRPLPDEFKQLAMALLAIAIAIYLARSHSK